jgi:type I restriction enzyme M protein
MFEQTFKNIDDILHKDAGCGSELDYVEQTSWILFLKYLDDLEKDKKTAAELSGKKYNYIIAPDFQWNKWAAPKDKEGKLDHHSALTGDDLADFVNIKLFPYFKQYKKDAESADTIEYKIGEIFSELKNRIQSGYNLREVINRIDELRFRTHAEKHEMSHLYEDKIKNMGNAGRNGGEYYTPRPLIRTIIKVVNPKIGETIYDGASGSAGFLCEAFDYLMNSKKLSTSDITTLQKKTFYGKEKKSLAYIIGTMNMILHGIEAPNIIHTNTLAENLSDIQEKDRYDVILANPPFGGKERAEVQQNFPIKTGETASLFMQHFVKILRAGGKAGVVIKNTFLSNTDNASVSLRKLLLESCNLHTVLDLPGGTFTGAGVKTVVLFFEKGSSTKNVWFYQLNLDRNLGKTNALNEKDLAEFVELQKLVLNGDEGAGETKNSWSLDVSTIDKTTYDLSAKNPNKKEEIALRQPNEIVEEMQRLDEESAEVLKSILELI